VIRWESRIGRGTVGNAEAGFLKAFNAARKRIHEVAEEVYARGRKGSYAYILAAADF